MREIKCRAWDRHKKEMIKPEEFEKEALYRFLYNLKYIIMQFTGFNDKNEKAIFEGDIVRFKDYLYIVEFSEINGWWCLVQPRKEDGNTLEEVYTGGVKGQDIFRCEVIGNVYENPELLEEGK